MKPALSFCWAPPVAARPTTRTSTAKTINQRIRSLPRGIVLTLPPVRYDLARLSPARALLSSPLPARERKPEGLRRALSAPAPGGRGEDEDREGKRHHPQQLS